jgi:hypothetical protein
MADPIRPRDLPPVNDGVVNPTAATIVDGGGQVQRATPVQLLDAAAPLSSQADAEAGTDNVKRMTPLRAAQAVAALAPVKSVAGKSGDVSLVKADVGLGSADNTSDANKPISTATATALAGKQPNLGFTPANKAGDTFSGAFGRDQRYYLDIFQGNTPFLNFDDFDSINYDRLNNMFSVSIGGTQRLVVSSTTLSFNGNTVWHSGNLNLVNTIRARVSGETSDDNAFAEALAALPASGGTIRVPNRAYVLNNQVDQSPKSVHWDIEPGAAFSGTGTGLGKWPYMVTNPAQLAVGPYIYSRSSQKSLDSNGGIGALNVEMVQPADYGAGQSVAFYAGAIGGNPNPAGNVWAFNPLVYAQPQAQGTYHCMEGDVNNDSPLANTKGISMVCGGQYDSNVGVEIISFQSVLWRTGLYVTDSRDAAVIRLTPSGRGVVLGAKGDDPIAMGNVPMTIKQAANGSPMVFLQRKTDTSPTSEFIRGVNAANSQNMFYITVTGDQYLAGNFGCNGAVPSGRYSLAGVLPEDGTASNASMAFALNKLRAALIAFGLGI